MYQGHVEHESRPPPGIPGLAAKQNPCPACQMPSVLQACHMWSWLRDPPPSHTQPSLPIITTVTPPHHTPPRLCPHSLSHIVNSGVGKPVARIREHIRHADILPLVFAVLPETFACNHHGHRRLGDQVVTERAKQYTVMVSFMRLALAGSTYPFRALRPLDPRMTSVGSSMSICQTIYQPSSHPKRNVA